MKRKNNTGTIFYSQSLKLWVAQKTIAGKRKSFYGKTEKEAYQKMIGMDSRSMKSFKDWCNIWMKTYKINDYKIGTFEKELRRFNCILDNCSFSDTPLNEITTYEVQMYINELNNRLKPKTIQNYMILINGAFKQAVKENLTAQNPCLNVSIPRTTAPDMVALNRFEKDIFLDFVKDNPYYDIFVFALNTGMRISEICGLTKDCIDFGSQLITIKHQLVRLKGRYILDSPKTTRSIRKVPINETTYDILKRHIMSSKDDFVFHNPNTKGMLWQNTLSRNTKNCFLDCYEQTKMEVFKRANFHSFRHTFATTWVVQGGNLTLLSKVLGHTDTAFTTRVYVQPSYDDVKSEMTNLVF